MLCHLLYCILPRYPLFISNECISYLAVNKVGEVCLFEKVAMCYLKSVVIVSKLLL